MPHIELNGRQFPLKSEPPKSGAMLAVAAAEKSGDTQKMMALFYRLVTSIVSDDVPEGDVDDALWEMDVEDIGTALEAATKTYTQDPTSAVPPTSSDSSDGSPDGKRSYRVVSLSERDAG